ncbi:MAG: putative photosynthetic complex assembly protein PuhC [Rhodobacteraceae bacterium]|jgi:putative photosynthetic complex assembly protein|nr:putative photosynthetic complex assembly protein PuhC [Paracoccaceae bacterium]
MAVLTPEQRLRQRDREMIPTVLVRAMFALVLASLVIVAYARLTDRPLEATPPTGLAVAKERPILLYGDMSGSARVLDLDGTVIADLDPSQGGFIAGVWRVLQRVRGQAQVALDAPVRLVLWEDGRLSILDDTTGWRAELTGFGADNLDAFARLLN